VNESRQSKFRSQEMVQKAAVWVQDKMQERRLADIGLRPQWRERINISGIDVKGSLRNNARLGDSVNEDHLLGIACGIDNGHPIPGVVLRQTDKRLLSVMAGNHRIGAVVYLGQNWSQTVSGYIVECTDEEADRFTRTDNRMHGLRQQDSESYQHVYALHKEYGTPINALAADFCLNEDSLRDIILSMKLREELENDKINTDGMSVTSLVNLNPIRQIKDVFMIAAQMAARFRMPCDRIAEMVKEVRAVRSVPQQLAVLDAWKDELEKDAKLPKAKRTTPAKTKLLKLLNGRGGLLSLLRSGGKDGKPIMSINDLCFEPQDAQKFIEVWKAISDRMKP